MPKEFSGEIIGDFMNRQKIFPANRQGGWITNDYFYFTIAKSFLQQSKDLNLSNENRVKELKERTKTEEPQWDNETLSSYVHHLVYDDLKQLDAVCIATQIFACMAVEAFLNLYGVKRLSEKFYKRNLERLGISEKLKILITMCTQEILEDEDEITQIARRMFDRRNSLVHPKTKEINDFSDLIPSESTNHLERAKEAVEETELFFKKFEEIVGNEKVTPISGEVYKMDNKNEEQNGSDG
ncbi:MAG: hypothetical protein QY302_16235 [Anaerolineales bacterium]|nr:MAG: hypothetical protein QY302_16235 [Anaerolineales bacterium]